MMLNPPKGCLTSNGASVVDYFIVSSELFKYISDFVVFPEQFSARVHLPIRCNFKTTHCDQSRAKSKDCNLPKRQKYSWSTNDSTLFADNLTCSCSIEN